MCLGSNLHQLENINIDDGEFNFRFAEISTAGFSSAGSPEVASAPFFQPPVGSIALALYLSLDRIHEVA